MRIAIDTNGLYMSQAGVARYIRGLLRGLKQVQPEDVEFSELAWPVENFDYRQPARALKTLYRELLWASFTAPRELRRRRSDLLHRTGVSYRIRHGSGTREVVTLYDLAVFRHPEKYRAWQRTAESFSIRRLSAADHVICISRATADEAMRLLGLDSRRLSVVHLGNDFDPLESALAERRPDSAPTEFFLFVGSLEPGKNLSLLTAVYQLAAERGMRLPALVIVGARREGVAEEGEHPANWLYLGRQPDEALLWLYRRAAALVFPSKYEGFGLPVLEAMSLGCPVICSRVASLPEVGGEAPLYADLTAASYLETMLAVGADGARRQEAILKGHDQAARFSWRKCASETIEVYRRVLA